ncbi:MAG TPA: DUF3006 domain-containing protein [Thermomicrobiales bacterium]|jgi:hypothetical protein|nr:DUF3006 domain-containing protein [Chloroflexota bacterium]HCG30534.1 DUF3006 domain-containing protein [Chloroflexota bacterium]HQX62231.1 DUF3006 domain-containing protein [Thermomicrobiales bacterium]HQZ90250.1 DUF3006 domain-containing protein [Thermomicrobiales bacterium]HRA30684.1 DUF3006 domain-containing protein [Thermomicrobiales bacterium]
MSARVTVDEISRTEHGELVATLVTDDGRVLVVPLASLPADVRDGDVLDASFERLPDETATRRERIDALQRRLFGEP